MSASRHRRDEERREQAAADLARAAAESEVIGHSALSRQAVRLRDHLAGADADPNDPIEVWGRRIGRSLSMVAFLGLLLYLAVTYL